MTWRGARIQALERERDYRNTFPGSPWKELHTAADLYYSVKVEKQKEKSQDMGKKKISN